MKDCVWVIASESLASEVPAKVIGRRMKLIRRAGSVTRYAGILGCTVMAALLVNCAMMQWSSAQITALQQPQFTLTDENDVDLLSANAYLQGL